MADPLCRFCGGCCCCCWACCRGGHADGDKPRGRPFLPPTKSVLVLALFWFWTTCWVCLCWYLPLALVCPPHTAEEPCCLIICWCLSCWNCSQNHTKLQSIIDKYKALWFLIKTLTSAKKVWIWESTCNCWWESDWREKNPTSELELFLTGTVIGEGWSFLGGGPNRPPPLPWLRLCISSLVLILATSPAAA